jgi:hypothetical protein
MRSVVASMTKAEMTGTGAVGAAPMMALGDCPTTNPKCRKKKLRGKP